MDIDDITNKVIDKIAEDSIVYMKKNTDDFIKHFDMLIGTMDAGVKATLAIFKNKRSEMKGLSEDEIIKKFSEYLIDYFLDHVNTLPKHSIILKTEIIEAWGEAVNITTNALKDALETGEIPT